MNLYARRRLVNYTVLTLAVCAAAIGLFWLVAILWTLVYNGVGALSLAVALILFLVALVRRRPGEPS